MLWAEKCPYTWIHALTPLSICMTVHTQGGWTALHMSSQEGHVDVVRALIAAKAHVNQQTKVM